MDFSSPEFWTAVLKIIAIDLVLSGDNAVVIALACRNLPQQQRRVGVFWGVVGAVGLRVVLTAFAAGLLGYPYLKLAGGVLLLWIGIKLLLPEQDGDPEIRAAEHLWEAVRIIVVADFIMSLDNVVAVAAASRGSVLLLVFGLAVSVPLIVWSSQIIMKAMERFPAIVTIGAGLLGYVAGEMMVADVAVREEVSALLHGMDWLAGAAGALLVVAVGHWMVRRKRAAQRRVL